MNSTNRHTVFVDSVGSEGSRYLLQGVLVDPQRFVDFPHDAWEGWILGDCPRPVKVSLTTVESLVTYLPGTHPDGPVDVRDARRQVRSCLAGVQNRLPLTLETGPADLPTNFFLSSDANLRPSTQDVVVECLLSSCAESADFRAWVAFNRWMDRMMGGDPDVGHLFENNDGSEKLVSTGLSMSVTSGLLMPFEIPIAERVVYGVIRIGEPKGRNLFASKIFMCDQCDLLQPGASLRRSVRFEEEGSLYEFTSEIARISSVG
jgi:hypothetical protein